MQADKSNALPQVLELLLLAAALQPKGVEMERRLAGEEVQGAECTEVLLMCE